MEVAVFGGQSVTIGTIASLFAQFLKGKEWFPSSPLLIRCIVALASLVLNAVSVFATTGQLNWETLAASFFSYVVAVAEYDHLFKPTPAV